MVQSISVGWALTALNHVPTGDFTGLYDHFKRAGEGVAVYVLDEDFADVPEHFEKRFHFDLMPEFSGGRYQESHGLMVASLIGSNAYGAAKEPEVYPVEFGIGQSLRAALMDKSFAEVPKVRTFAEALDDIRAHDATRRCEDGYKGAVLNISRAIFDPALPRKAKAALKNVASAGICVVVAAGNAGRLLLDDETRDYEDMGIIIVGSIDKDLKPAKHSNRGKGVVIYAPGVDVACSNGYGRRTQAWGTSLACALVSGIVATFYGAEGKNMTAARAKQLLLKNAGRHIYKGDDGKKWRVRIANNGLWNSDDHMELPYDGADEPDLDQDSIVTAESQWPGLAPWVDEMNGC